MPTHTNEPRYTIELTEFEQGHLKVNWGDGHTSLFHPVWLRHQCECEACGTSVTGVRNIRIHHIPQDITPAQVCCSENRLQITWADDQHRSAYSADWLRRYCNSDSERKLRNHQPTPWDGSIDKQIPVADFIEVSRDSHSRLKMLETVCDLGFCKVINAPTKANQAGQLIELVGQQRQTHYGTYKLSKKSSIDNVGDITSALDPHIDETYRLSGIGIVVFQVLRPSSNGGESTLVDGFEAARRLRHAYPDDFELLTRAPVICHRLDPGNNSEGQSRWYESRLPVIKLDSEDNICGVRLNERQIVATDVRQELVGPCYQALRRIFEILYDPALRLTFKLKAGEGLLFDNQRVLHGRTEFTPEQPPRSVLTSSVDLEDFYSNMRLLRSGMGMPRRHTTYSQGMAG